MTDKDRSVYLCGPVEQDDNPRTWRDEIKDRYPEVDFIDPMDFQEDWDTDPEAVIEKELSVCEEHAILVCNVGLDGPRTARIRGVESMIHPEDDVAHNILNERRGGPIDKDPLMECDGCGESHRASYYDEHGQITNDPDEPLLCGICVNKPVGTRTVEERREANQSLSEYEVTR